MYEDTSLVLTSAEKKSWCRLGLISGLGPKGLSRLTKRFGSVEALLSASRRQLEQNATPAHLINALLNPDWGLIEKHLQWLDQTNHHLIPIYSHRYPPLLQEISNPPILLWVHGNPAHLHRPQLAVVGSRKPSRAGVTNARTLSRALAQSGLVITSGLALGVDAEAHRGALDENQATIAVVGTGLDQVYPARHQELAQQIVSSGAVVSEFPLGTGPKPPHFPRRNRIISGLSKGVLIVEAGLKSGSLITANYSAQFGREVFAVPGPLTPAYNIGCHKLIKDGAKLVESVEDVLQELPTFHGNLEGSRQEGRPATPDLSLDPDAVRLLDCLGNAAASVDDLVEISELQPAELLSKLLTLELEGYVEALPDGRFVRSPNI